MAYVGPFSLLSYSFQFIAQDNCFCFVIGHVYAWVNKQTLSFLKERIAAVRRKGGNCLEIGHGVWVYQALLPCHAWLLSSLNYFVLVSQHKGTECCFTHTYHPIYLTMGMDKSHVSFGVLRMGLSCLNVIVQCSLRCCSTRIGKAGLVQSLRPLEFGGLPAGGQVRHRVFQTESQRPIGGTESHPKCLKKIYYHFFVTGVVCFVTSQQQIWHIV